MRPGWRESEAMSTPCLADHTETEEACGRLILDFVDGLDFRDYEQALRLFIEDATLDRAGLVMRGLSEIRAFLEQRPEQMVTRHLCTNIRVRATGDDEAEGRCYLQFFQASNEHGQPLPIKASTTAVAEYQVGFVHQNGHWRIKALIIRPVFQA